MIANAMVIIIFQYVSVSKHILPLNLHSQLYFNKTRMKVTEICQKTKCLHRSLPALTQLVKFSHSVMSNSVTPWTVTHQTPLSMEFSSQEY